MFSVNRAETIMLLVKWFAFSNVSKSDCLAFQKYVTTLFCRELILAEETTSFKLIFSAEKYAKNSVFFRQAALLTMLFIWALQTCAQHWRRRVR
jgi:hypothetical protein